MGFPYSVNIGLKKNTPQNNRRKVNKKIPREFQQSISLSALDGRSELVLQLHGHKH